MNTINSDISFEELPFHLNLKDEDIVFITSDASKFALKAKKEGNNIDINRFIDNFQKVLPNGTLVVPTYTDTLLNGDTFNYEKSKATTGAISNRVLKRKDFTRTTDPLHSVCVWGKDKEEILLLKDESTFGENSIFNYLHQKNCIFIFFDVHINKSFTYIHYLEERFDVPYRKFRNYNITVEKNGQKTKTKVKFHTRKLGVISTIMALNQTLIDRGLLNRYDYDGIFIDKITAEDTAKTATEFLYQKKYFYYFSLKEFFKMAARNMLHTFKSR